LTLLSQCSPNTVHWDFDTYMLAKGIAGPTVKAGGKRWYLLTPNYVFGQQMQRDTTSFVTGVGGVVSGASVYPFPDTTDFSSFLLSAQSSGANVLALANSGAHTINSIKQAAEFGLTNSMRVTALLMFVTDVHGLGLQAAQNLFLTESFYWDLNDKTRAFAKRFQQFMPSVQPNMTNAANYSGAMHFLKTVKKLGPAQASNGAAMVAAMKSLPAEDDAYGRTVIRQDGIALVPSYLFQVKTPAEGTQPWDYYKLIATTPAEEAFRPLDEGGCHMQG